MGEEKDLIEQALSLKKKKRQAEGEVQGYFVILGKHFVSKEGMHAFQVMVQLVKIGTQTLTKNFVEEKEADEVFDKLVEKYGLTEQYIHAASKGENSGKERMKTVETEPEIKAGGYYLIEDNRTVRVTLVDMHFVYFEYVDSEPIKEVATDFETFHKKMVREIEVERLLW